MSFGDPLLLTGNTSGTLLSRIPFQQDSGQTYQECALQEVIDRWPYILPIRDYYPNVEGVCSLGREIPVPIAGDKKGRIDNLLVTDDGHLIIVETKLWLNSEAVRDVIAQTLQYCMGVSQLSSHEFECCLRSGDSKGTRLGADETVFQRVCKLLPNVVDDFEEAFDRLRHNGDILLLIVGDGIRSSAERLVEWMNGVVGSNPYKLGLIELRFYDVPDAGRIIVPRTLLRIKEASRHVVTISLRGLSAEQVTATVTPPNGGTTIIVPPIPLTEEQLTAQIRAQNPPEIAELAEGLRSRLRALGVKTRGLPASVSYGVEVDGNFVTLLSFAATNMWFQLPRRAINALGDERFVTCKKTINGVVNFFRPEDVSDPTKWASLCPRFRVLDGKLDAFVEAFTEIADTVRGAVAQAV